MSRPSPSRASAAASGRWRARALALLGGAALLAALELALRALGFGGAARDFAFEPLLGAPHTSQLLQQDRERFFRLRPAARASPQHACREAIGSWGQRGRAAWPAPEETPRVLCLGDSCVFGSELRASQTLPEQLALELERAGWPLASVQVLNGGVPGYSCVQIRVALQQALRELRPRAVVIYAAAWNDQGPALGLGDVALEAARARHASARWLWESASFDAARRLSDAWRAPRAALAEIQAAWSRGAPLYGTRLTRAEVRSELERMLALCAAAGARCVLVAPAHPASTHAQYPGTVADAECVREVARAAGLAWLDAQPLLDALPCAETERFVDFVHPSPRAQAELARALAPLVLPALGTPPREGAPSALAIERMEPAQPFALGDERVRIELRGWSRAEPLPAVVIGGAPLLDLRAEGERTLIGTSSENAPGEVDLLVQTDRACARARVVLRAPELAASGPRRVRVHSRPGDRVWLAGALARLPPRADGEPDGLAIGPLFGPQLQASCDARGAAEFELPLAPGLARGQRLELQAAVLPAGAASAELRYSNALSFEIGD